MNIQDIQNIEQNVNKAYEMLNELDSNGLELIDLAFPNHDGVQDVKATGELMYLRQSVNSLKKVCELAVEKLNAAIQDSLESEIIKTGFRYRENEDGSFDICYDHKQDSYFETNSYHTATLREDNEYWYVDNNCGLSGGGYPKADYTLLEAIYDQCGDWSE